MMVRSAISLLLAALLLVSDVLAVDDYFYDEEMEEVESTDVPQFTSTEQTLSVTAGDDVSLPCYADIKVAVVIWKSGKNVVFTGDYAGGKDPRFKLKDKTDKGNTLSISGLRPEDNGTYECQIPSNPPVSLKHVVNVKYPPMVTTVPQNGVVVVKQGGPSSLACRADGNPKPTVTWTRKGGVLPNGEKKLEGETLEIASVDRTHMGNYTCTVDNGVGKAVVKDFRLEVNFAPEIEVLADTVHTGAGYEAQLVCKVRGQPLPQVTWKRIGGALLDKKHHVEGKEGDMYSLSIDKVMDSDMGRYSCRARSDMGTAETAIEVTGKPTTVVVTSKPNGDEKDTYTLQWSVESYAPIEEYKISYKNVETNGTDVALPKKWEEVVVAAPSSDGGSSVMYKYTFQLRDLEPASVYEAIVTARNKYGWSQDPSAPFRLSTLGAHGPAADLKGGEALGSTDPNGASTLRSGLLASLAAIFALVVVL